MTNTRRVGISLVCATVALCTGVAAALGVFARGDEVFESVSSVRGEQYDMATTGVYAYNAERIVAEGVGWDIFTLLFAVPALLATVPSLRRGSLRGKLFAVGLLGYTFYQYLMYAVAWAFGPLLLLFIVIYALSLTGIVLILSTISVSELPQRFSEDFPARGMAILSVAMATLLIFMWLKLILSSMNGEVQGILQGQTTLVVQAMDLGLIVPLALYTGITAWRREPIGYLLSSTVVVKAFAMAGAICAMLLSAWAYEGSLEIPPLIIFATAAATSFWLGLRMFRSVLKESAPEA